MALGQGPPSDSALQYAAECLKSNIQIVLRLVSSDLSVHSVHGVPSLRVVVAMHQWEVPVCINLEYNEYLPLPFFSCKVPCATVGRWQGATAVCGQSCWLAGASG